MINVFGDEHLRPIVKYGVVIPDYYVTACGKVYSAKSRQYLKFAADYSKRSGRLEALKFTVEISPTLFDDYEYRRREGRKNSCVTVRVHKAVMEAWKPINENPPEKLKETWNQIITPDMVGQPRITPEWKEWVAETAYVDHIDDDPTNNNKDNLRWVIPKDNSCYRKKYMLESDDEELVSEEHYEIIENTAEISRREIQSNKVSFTEVSEGDSRVSGTLSGWW